MIYAGERADVVDELVEQVGVDGVGEVGDGGAFGEHDQSGLLGVGVQEAPVDETFIIFI